ncbi:MAG: D-alanine--D-alanine ligase [Synergistaceae bacterium]|nr:D-alanine--D-alanine ligase [Synergistaceae bacterium]
MNNNGTNIVVLYGGDGYEREVSLKSGETIINALTECSGFTVTPFVINKIAEAEKLKEMENAFVLIALHGSWGEDGRIQKQLELMNIPHSGSDSKSCLLAMDKSISRELFIRSGLTVPKAFVFCQNEDILDFSIHNAIRYLGLPCVVKPCTRGSTVGVSIVKEIEELGNAFESAFKYDAKVLLEEYIEGKELTVTIFGDTRPEALPIIEIVPKSGFYGYEEKYTKGTTSYICPAHLDENTASIVKEEAVKAHISLGCKVYSRVDIRLSKDSKPYILEVNTVPGMTETSLVPKSAAAAGMSFSEFLSKVIKMSRERFK